MVMVMVMVMVVLMAVRMIVVMTMIVMICAGYGIGPALRLKRRIDRGDLRTRGLQQRFDIARSAHAQAIGQKFDRHMAVAEVPGEPRQRRRIGRSHLEQWFGFRHDLDETTVVEQQNVVVAQPHRLGEIEFDAGTFHAEEKSALGRALRAGENKRVDDAARLTIG